jgi:hypothetical protein
VTACVRWAVRDSGLVVAGSGSIPWWIDNEGPQRGFDKDLRNPAMTEESRLIEGV